MSGCPTTTVEAHENCGAPPMGLAGYPGPFSSPQLDNQYKVVAQRNKPSGAPSSFLVACEASLRARGIIYYKTNPGDCPRPTGPSSGIGGGQIVGLSGMAASGAIGGLGAAGGGFWPPPPRGLGAKRVVRAGG